MSQVPAPIARRPLARQDTAAEMKTLGKTYAPHVFVDGASHRFLLAQAGSQSREPPRDPPSLAPDPSLLRDQLK